MEMLLLADFIFLEKELGQAAGSCGRQNSETVLVAILERRGETRLGCRLIDLIGEKEKIL
jgi:hypothetical protein